MKNLLPRAILGIAGLLFMIFGMIFLMNPMTALASMSVVLGVIMLTAGILNIIGYIQSNKWAMGSNWLLLEGTLTLLVAAFILFNHYFTALSLTLLFSLWIIATGVVKAANAARLKKYQVRGWGLQMTYGIFLIVVGIVLIMHPFFTALTVSMLIGAVLILGGINNIIDALFLPRLAR